MTTSKKENCRCWRCGRATTVGARKMYVFGPVCDRAECKRVRQAFDPAYQMFWFAASPPAENGDPGRASSFGFSGERTGCRGLKEATP